MVSISMRHDVNLVQKDYYIEELAYQDQIDRIKNFKDLAEKPQFVRNGDDLSIHFPIVLTTIKHCEIWLYRPSVSQLDQKFTIQLDENNQAAVPLKGLTRGLWKIKISWSDGAKEFFTEETLVL